MTMLRMPNDLQTRLAHWAREGYPFETCGVMIGRQENGATEVMDLKAARNVNRERARDRYELDPEDLLAADAYAREAGLEIVGVWHSHPDHPARPSETDRVNAWEGWSYVIASVGRDGVKDVRSWRLKEGYFIEEAMTR